jgi:hypothetical protein
LQEQAKFTKALLKAQADYQNQVELFGPTSKEAAKALEKVEKAQEAVNAVTVEGADFTDDLIKQFGGANKAFTETAAGGLQKLSIAFGETKESIGAAFLPILLKLQPVLDKFATWAQENPDLLAAVIAGMGILAVSILAVNAAMMLNPAVAITAGIIALGVSIVAAYKKFEGFRVVVRTVVNFVAAYVEGMANGFIKAINIVIAGINMFQPGKDINALQEISIGRMAEPVAPADLGRNGSANAVENNNNVNINVYGGDPNQVVAALRTYMRTNGAVPIRISDAF